MVSSPLVSVSLPTLSCPLDLDREYGFTLFLLGTVQTWKIASTETGSVAEMSAPYMMLSWKGSLYIRKNNPPRYLQRGTSFVSLVRGYLVRTECQLEERTF